MLVTVIAMIDSHTYREKYKMKPTHILFAVIFACFLCSCTSEQRLFMSLGDAKTAYSRGQLSEAEYSELKGAIIQKYKGGQGTGACTDTESNQ